MPLVYITGPAGAGKSTVCKELQERGYEAHDTDENGLSAWYNIETGTQVKHPNDSNRPADWYKKHIYRLSPQKTEHLAEKAKNKPIFLCGIPGNDLDLAAYFGMILCLEIDIETMKQRIANRDTNDFGKTPDQLQLLLYWHDKVIKRYKDFGVTMIDASQPLTQVVDKILSLTDATPQ